MSLLERLMGGPQRLVPPPEPDLLPEPEPEPEDEEPGIDTVVFGSVPRVSGGQW